MTAPAARPIAPFWARVVLGAAVGAGTWAALDALPGEAWPAALAGYAAGAFAVAAIVELGRGRARFRWRAALAVAAALLALPLAAMMVAHRSNAALFVAALALFCAGGVRALFAFSSEAAAAAGVDGTLVARAGAFVIGGFCCLAATIAICGGGALLIVPLVLHDPAAMPIAPAIVSQLAGGLLGAGLTIGLDRADARFVRLRLEAAERAAASAAAPERLTGDPRGAGPEPENGGLRDARGHEADRLA